MQRHDILVSGIIWIANPRAIIRDTDADLIKLILNQWSSGLRSYIQDEVLIRSDDIVGRWDQPSGNSVNWSPRVASSQTPRPCAPNICLRINIPIPKSPSCLRSIPSVSRFSTYQISAHQYLPVSVLSACNPICYTLSSSANRSSSVHLPSCESYLEVTRVDLK